MQCCTGWHVLSSPWICICDESHVRQHVCVNPQLKIGPTTSCTPVVSSPRTETRNLLNPESTSEEDFLLTHEKNHQLFPQKLVKMWYNVLDSGQMWWLLCPSTNFCANPFNTFCVILLKNKQRDRGGGGTWPSVQEGNDGCKDDWLPEVGWIHRERTLSSAFIVLLTQTDKLSHRWMERGRL